MGMFDTIIYPGPCPICGNADGYPTLEWQSKDAGCFLEKLTPAELWQQRETTRTASYNRPAVQFYANCDKCGKWIDITISPGHVERSWEEHLRIFNGEKLPPAIEGPVIP